MSKNTIKLNTVELKDLIKHFVKTNRILQDAGKTPVALCVEGVAGIGKTSAILQVADELGIACVKLNLSQLGEVGDLVGFPVKEFEMSKEFNGELLKKWIPESLFDYTIQNEGFIPTGNKRMGTAIPEWIEGKSENGILLLDDFSRANPMFMQCIMELIDRQTYASWKLPKGWTILLSSNPEDGDYHVTSTDEAQKSRYTTVTMKFDIKTWAEWAEQNSIDGRCINFMLLHPELVTEKTNPRRITNFFNTISSISDFENNLGLIKMLGEGSVGPEFTSLFTIFIANKLDLLITPESIMTHDWDFVNSKLKSTFGKDETYRPDIASILAQRICNYVVYTSTKEMVHNSTLERISKLVLTDELFTNDLRYYMTRHIINGNRTKFQKLTMNPEIIKMLTK